MRNFSRASLFLFSMLLALSYRVAVFNAKQPQTLRFSVASYTTGEGGPAVFVVTRSGSAGAVSVNYVTANGTATAGSDYAAMSGTLNFAANETSKAVAIAINNDTAVEPNETFSVTLSNPAGAALAAPVTATVTIADDDTNSVAGAWSDVMNWPVVPTHMSLLPNGKVLFWDRHDHEKNWDGTPRLWDPVTNGFTTLAAPNYDLFCSGHSFMADGKLLVTGGHISLPPPLDSGVGEDKTALFDPATNLFTPLPLMNAGRWYPSNVTLANGDVLVMGGTMRNGNSLTVSVNPLPQVWQAASNAWRNLSGATQGEAPNWPDYYPFLYLAPNGRVFCAGPQRLARYLDTTGAGAWTEVANSSVAYRDYGTSVLYRDGKVLIVGGNPRDPNDKAPTLLPSDSAEVIDLADAQPAWRAVPSLAVGRRHLNATLLPDGKVLVTGGSALPGFNKQEGAVLFAEQWNPDLESWQPLAGYKRYRGYHSNALLLPDGRVVVGGGGHPNAEGFPDEPNIEIYSPPYLFKGARPSIDNVPSPVNYGQTFFVRTPDGASVAQVNWLRLGSVTHAFNQNQRINRLGFTATTGGLNVTAPANANLCPPGHYLLFLLNGNGVPSIGRVIQILPACNVSIAPASRSFEPNGGAGTIDVATPSNCGWNATTNQTWITINNSPNGSGNGTINYTVAPNNGAARNGTISVSGQTFTITQDGSALNFRAVSAGFFAGDYAEFLRDGVSFYRQTGGAGSGRGFNVAALDRCTGQLREPVRNFDTWGSRDGGAAHRDLIDFLQRQPNGTLLLIAVGDEAGLTQFDNCMALDRDYVRNVYLALEALGSKLIRNYCYRDSWSLITVKGVTAALDEQLSRTNLAATQTLLNAPLTIAPAQALSNGRVGTPYAQTFTATGVTGTVAFSVSAGALPGGLTLTTGGALSGTPVTPGAFSFTVRATDANSCAGTRNYTLTVSSNLTASVSAASFSGGEVAPESIVSAFGDGMTAMTAPATVLPLPTTLAGVTVSVRDSAGVERLAPLFYVSPSQLNYLLPAATAPGVTRLTITSGNAVSVGTLQVARVAPGLFAANANGQGVAAAVVLRVKANGAQSYETIARFDTATGHVVSTPIDLGPAGEQVFLLLFGTGLHGRSSLTATTLLMGGADAQVLYAGAQGDLVGLDQVNVAVLRTLIGRGEIDIVLTMDGKAANTVRIAIK